MFAFQRDHDVVIDAPADTVWQVVTDFGSYPEWNPFAREVHCDLAPGNPIDMRVSLVGKRLLRQREYINSVGPGHTFSYSMRPVRCGLLNSERVQTVTDLGGGRSRYTATFRIGGLLAPVVRLLLGRALRRGFDSVAAAIRPRAELLDAA